MQERRYINVDIHDEIKELPIDSKNLMTITFVQQVSNECIHITLCSVYSAADVRVSL